MAKIKKFDVFTIPVEVVYINPVLGRLFGAVVWFKLLQFKKFNLTMNNTTVYSFYRLIVPRFLKGENGGDPE